MKSAKAIEIIAAFKEGDLKSKFKRLKDSIKSKGDLDGLNLYEVYEAGLRLKELSKQVDEIIHATGIIRCLTNILEDEEEVKGLSLASAGGIDLETNLRIAEFKFSRWQKDGGNGMRERGVFADLVGLYVSNIQVERKELYVLDKEIVVKFLSTCNSNWFEKLSKSTRVRSQLEEHFNQHNLTGIKTVSQVYELAAQHVKIIHIESDLSTRINTPTV
jgi:hypothetical protein